MATIKANKKLNIIENRDGKSIKNLDVNKIQKVKLKVGHIDAYTRLAETKILENLKKQRDGK